MGLIKRYEKCIGITLWKWDKFLVELWIIPPRFEIDEHCHPHQDIKILYLWGNATFFRSHKFFNQHRMFTVSWKTPFRMFTVEQVHNHHFINYDQWLVFINFERWFIKPTSASVDIEFSNKEQYASTKS